MEQAMTWEAAAHLVDQIDASADSGNWHAQVEAVAGGYAVAVRQHNTPTAYYVASLREFLVVCNRLYSIEPGAL